MRQSPLFLDSTKRDSAHACACVASRIRHAGEDTLVSQVCVCGTSSRTRAPSQTWQCYRFASAVRQVENTRCEFHLVHARVTDGCRNGDYGTHRPRGSFARRACRRRAMSRVDTVRAGTSFVTHRPRCGREQVEIDTAGHRVCVDFVEWRSAACRPRRGGDKSGHVGAGITSCVDTVDLVCDQS